MLFLDADFFDFLVGFLEESLAASLEESLEGFAAFLAFLGFFPPPVCCILELGNADKLTSMPPMMQGQVPQQVGPLRSTSGVMALMNEAQTPLDVYLDRFRYLYI